MPRCCGKTICVFFVERLSLIFSVHTYNITINKNRKLMILKNRQFPTIMEVRKGVFNMSVALQEVVKQDIDRAYNEKIVSRMEKETRYILSQLVTMIMWNFEDRLEGIIVKKFDFDKDYLTSEQNRNMLMKWLQRMAEMNPNMSDLEFGKLRVDLESWIYRLGGKNVKFNYTEEYLLTPQEASKILGVSKVTVNKYIKMGLEAIDTTSHRKIPKHAVELWKNTIYSLKMQDLYNKRKMLTQTTEEKLMDVKEKILHFQKKYGKQTSAEAFEGCEIDELDNPYDYWEWRDLEKLERKLFKMILEEKRG